MKNPWSSRLLASFAAKWFRKLTSWTLLCLESLSSNQQLVGTETRSHSEEGSDLACLLHQLFFQWPEKSHDWSAPLATTISAAPENACFTEHCDTWEMFEIDAMVASCGNVKDPGWISVSRWSSLSGDPRG